MAEVFLARKRGPAGFRKDLVIKRILPHLARSPSFVRLFLNEARVAALIDHPNLVHVSAFGEIDGQLYLAMEFVDGFTLQEVSRRLGALTPGVACRIATDVLDALHAVHTASGADGRPLGLNHRDVSPRNVMVTRDGAVKLLDFGIATRRGDELAVRMGTRRYMSPEQIDGRPEDARSDLYLVGLLLMTLLTGHSADPSHLRHRSRPVRPADVPERLWPTLVAALDPVASGRPASARAMQAELELFLADRGAEGTRTHLAYVLGSIMPAAAPVGPSTDADTRPMTVEMRSEPSSSPEPAPRRRGAVAWTAVGVSLLVGVVVGVSAGWPRPAPTIQPAIGRPRPAEAPALPTPSNPRTPRDAGIAIAETVQRASAPPRKPAVAPPVRRRPASPGRLTIDTRPWTEVFLGARRLGMTPLHGVELTPGVHRLRLVNEPQGLETTVRVKIRSGRETRIRRSL